MFGTLNLGNLSLGAYTSTKGGTWAHPTAVRAADYRNNRYMQQGLEYAFADLASVTRAGNAWLDAVSGVWSEFLTGALRRTDRGAAIGGQFTNKIRNPRGEGGTVGVIGSGGALPTNWATTGSLLGLTISYVGQSTVAGLPAVRVRYQGTASATSNVNIQMETPTYAGAAPGQAFGVDAQVALVAGSIGDATLKATINGNAAGGGFVEVVANGGNVVPTSSPVRAFASGVVSGATVAAVKPMLSLNVVSGTTYDFTLDFIAPKLVQITSVESAEIVTNGDFASATGWSDASNGTGTAVIAGGVLTITSTGIANSGKCQQLIDTVAGAIYAIEWVVSAGGTGGNAVVEIAGSYFGETAAGTTNKLYFQAAGASTLIGARVASYSGSQTIESISVKRITAGYLPRFPILPPVGVPGDSTKFADDVQANNMVWFIDDLSVGATQLIVPNFNHVTDGLFRYLFEYSDGTLNNRLVAYIDSEDKPVLKIVVSGVTLATVTHPTTLTIGRKPLVFGWGVAGLYITDGVVTESAVAVTLPTITEYREGGSVASANYLNDIIEQVQQCLPLSQAAAEAFALAV